MIDNTACVIYFFTLFPMHFIGYKAFDFSDNDLSGWVVDQVRTYRNL